MILGVGFDLCDVNKLRRALARPGFRERVFDPIEVRSCDRRARREEHYAARFAAKEACLKALGTGWGDGVGFRDVAVSGAGGPPSLRLSGGAARRARSLGVTRSHLTLSHSGDYAAAVVVLEGASTGPRRPRRSGR
ncbi:MAG TPA: holo-ACP synthase [Candidatus Polarisedimenticolia bacterium]|nr:holo-ACP synthase [Candidatus Polarisedimenticolia bacterium]